MRPRMYGSSDSQWLRTSTSPGRGSGTSFSTMLKFASVTQPSGRLASSTCRFLFISFGPVKPRWHGNRNIVAERCGRRGTRRGIIPGVTLPPLVLVPGLLCDAALWASQVATLREETPCWVADVTRDDTMEGMARRVLEEVPYERFALAGLSMGGFV